MKVRNIKMIVEIKYYVQVKGIKENENCWRTQASFDTLKRAIKIYNSYKGGCCKRILKRSIVKNEKVMRYKKY